MYVLATINDKENTENHRVRWVPDKSVADSLIAKRTFFSAAEKSPSPLQTLEMI
jgi:hypothetical protein